MISTGAVTLCFLIRHHMELPNNQVKLKTLIKSTKVLSLASLDLVIELFFIKVFN